MLERAFDLGNEDEFNLDLDAWRRVLARQCVPFVVILSVAKQFRFSEYAAHVTLEGISEASFYSKEPADIVATHAHIKLRRFNS